MVQIINYKTQNGTQRHANWIYDAKQRSTAFGLNSILQQEDHVAVLILQITLHEHSQIADLCINLTGTFFVQRHIFVVGF